MAPRPGDHLSYGSDGPYVLQAMQRKRAEALAALRRNEEHYHRHNPQTARGKS